MAIVFLISFIMIGLSFYIFNSKTTFSKNKYIFFVIAFSGLIIRFIAAFCHPGHETDMQCFGGWADMIYKDGFSAFYESAAFTDYPPGYMYILYIIGFINNTFNLSLKATGILLKTPAIICDILCGYMVYNICQKYGKENLKNILAGFFILNPSVILNSAIWGQVDSVFTVFVLLMLYLLTDKKTIPAYFVFALAIFIKPQALFYAPVLLFGIIENVFLINFSKKKFCTNLISGIGAIALIFLLAFPFGIGNVINQYISTINSYNYATVNAYNFWCALGLNWADVTLGMSAIGTISIIFAVSLSGYIFFVKHSDNRYFFTSGLICFIVFMMSVRMHERYAFPAIALFLCALAVSSSKKDFWIFTAVSVLQFINSAHILFFYNNDAYFTQEYRAIMLITSWLSVIVLGLFVISLFRNLSLSLKINKGEKLDQPHPISRKDVILMCIITAVYSAIALYNLGDTKAPQTYEIINGNNSVSADLGESRNISSLRFYIGADPIDDNEMLELKFSDSEHNIVLSETIDKKSVFTWNDIEDINVQAKYLDISANGEIHLFELGLFDNAGNIITPDKSSMIFDEPDLIPENISYRNSMYFDEIYHARTAYEFLENLPVYEWTHPPLGKAFISLGIKLFGMTPFGWRIIGTLFGIFMIPLIYIFSKKMFGITWVSVCSAILFSFDFMHYAQTRIATIDVYITFFVILMYLFMYLYYSSDILTMPYKKMFAILGLCGISMGLGIASKWTGVYAGAGLAILFFITQFRTYKKSDFFKNKSLKTMIFCVLSFVVVPALIYVISYIPYLKATGGGFEKIIQNQIDMFTYHGDTVVSSTHSFSSPWYQWLINYRPIWYYTGINADGLTENISSFGNPLIWTGGLLALLYCIYDAVKNQNKKAQFLVIGYLAQLLPWVFVTRITFIYHYFPSVPFLVLMLAHTAVQQNRRNPRVKYFAYGFTIAAVIVFIAFYPVISGFPVDGDYVRNFLRWLPSWQLIG